MRKKTIILISTSILAAGILLFPGKALAMENETKVPVASNTTVIVEDDTELQPEYTGWQVIDGKRYYFDTITHQPVTGIQEIDDTTYLFDYTGVQKTGWRTVNGIRTYYNPKSGEPEYGWIETNGKRYYANEKGKQTGEIQVDGVRYLLDKQTGAQKTGFCTFSDGTMSYYDADGSILEGWISHKNGLYYSQNGVILVGWQTIDEKQYYFQNNGVAFTGWKTDANKKYYFNSKGEMQIGWLFQDAKWFYLKNDGTIVEGWQNIDGKRYFFSHGMALMGWQTIAGETYYFTHDGITVGDATISGKKYHFGKTGCMTPPVIAWQQGDGADQQRTRYLLNTRRWDNYVWTVCGENDQTIGNSACGIFALINSVYYKKDVFLDPITVADWTKANGYRTAHAGVDVRFFQAYLNAFGSKYGIRFSGRLYSVDAALQHVRSGGTICANIPGHWIAVVDYDPKTGKYLMLDSAASYPRTSTISNWQSTGVAWVSPQEFVSNPAYQFFVSNRRVYAISYT